MDKHLSKHMQKWLEHIEVISAFRPKSPLHKNEDINDEACIVAIAVTNRKVIPSCNHLHCMVLLVSSLTADS